MRQSGRAGVCGGLVVLLLAACGQPTVVPAGSAGLEVPAEPRAAQAKPKAPPVAQPAAKAAKPSSKAVPAKKQAAAPAAEQVQAAEAPAPQAQPTKAASSPKRPAPPAALPGVGTYTYKLIGSSSLGPPPPTFTLTVADAGSGAQLWTMDQRRQDGAGLIEELTLRRQKAGVALSAYRLDASTGLAGVILEFNPDKPVLLTPSGGNAGSTWSFDLGTSTDGCATADGEGVLLDEGKGSALRMFRLTTTLRTVGSASCVRLEGERVQEISHPANLMLPNLIDSTLEGTVAGVAFKANTAATRSPAKGQVASRPALATDRVRR
ncbi:MAG: hypothetical protein ACT4QG_22915 [Sporichthyaceae bacterium]